MRFPKFQTLENQTNSGRTGRRNDDHGFGWILVLLVLGMFGYFCETSQGAVSTGAGTKDTPPFISAIGDQIVDEDSLTIPIRVLYGDAETPVPQLRLRAASSNTSLLAEISILFNDSTPREMVMVPAPNQNGVTKVTLTVEDAQGNKASQSFQLTVNPVNDPPSLVAIESLTFLEDAPLQTVPLVVTDPESRSEELIVSAESLNPLLVPKQNMKVEGTGKDRMLSVSPATDQSGSAIVVLTVRDPEGAESKRQINIRVLPVNDPPQLSLIPDQHVVENQAIDSIQLTLVDDETPASELRLEGFSSNPLLVPDGNILFGGSGDKRTISIRPTKNLTGTSLITVRAYDRERLVSNTSFQITVDHVNAVPGITGLVNITVDQDNTAGPLSFGVTDLDGPVELVRVEATSSNPDLVPTAGIRLIGLGKERTLLVAPSPGASGTAEITLSATDSAGGQGRASFILTVRASTLRPIAQALSVAVTEDNSKAFTLEGVSPSGHSLTFALVSRPKKGVLTGEPPLLTYVPNPNVSGSDSFLFKVADGSLESPSSNVTITIQEVNDPPTISSIASRTSEPGMAIGPIQFTVEDVETPPSQLRVTGRSSNPDLVADQNIVIAGQDNLRTITLIPAQGKTGMASITLTVNDSSGLSAIATFELSIAEASGAPTAEAQSLITLEDLSVSIPLRGRDSGGQPVVFAIVDPPSKGTLVGIPPNLVYLPKPNVSGQDRFTFKVRNATRESTVAAVDILIIQVNDPPAARSQSYTIKEDTAQEIELSANDPDSDSLAYEVINLPTRGKLSGTPPHLTYTPNPDETGSDQFTFIARDAEFVSAPGSIRITIDPVNDAPAAFGSFVSAPEDSVIPITLKARDVDGDPLVYSIVTLPAKGVLAGSPPDLVYIANANTTGLDRFTLRVSDGRLSSEEAVVTIVVLPVNDPPVAESQFVSMAEDSSADILLIARDVDGDPLSFVITSGPYKGSISGAMPRLIYRPDRDFNGIDSFTYKISDGMSESQAATITLSVRPVNDAPLASDQFVTLNEDTSQGILLAARDVDGDLLPYRVVDPPKNGSVSGVAPYLIYTPTLDFNGEDRFTYSASDGQLESLPATVKISVRPVNDAPVANNQFLTVPQGRSQLVVLNATDVDGGTLQFILTSLPTKGLITGKPPNLTYLPNPNERGLDSFSFKASDGLLESSPGTVQIALTEKTSGPSVSPIPNQTSRQGEPTPKLPFTVRDAETPAEKLVVAASSSNPALVPSENISIEGSGTDRTVRVTPAKAKTGTTAITLVAWDEDGLAASIQFTLTVVFENSPPIAVDISLSTPEDQPVAIDLKATDPDNDLLTFTVVSPPKNGILSGQPPKLVYSPQSAVTGTDSFTYKARDTTSESGVATVTVQILPINDPPTISRVSDQTIERDHSLGPLMIQVSDPDTPLANLKISVKFSNPDLILASSVSLSGSGASRILTAAAAVGKAGITSVTISVTDGELSASTTFQLTIIPPNQLPTIELVNPEDLSVIDPTNPLVLDGKATDSDGTIARVEFYVGSTLLGSAATAPFQFTWKTLVKGQYLLTAKAIDNRGGESVSKPVKVLVDRPVGRVAILSSSNNADLDLIRRYLFELPARWTQIPSVAAKLEDLVRQYDAVVWHQPSDADVQSRDLILLESLAKIGMPLYFQGDSLLAASRRLSSEERSRWQNLIHLKPGGTTWLNQVTILKETDHPVILNGSAGASTDFTYPVTVQQAGVRAGLPGEVVLGRSGTFDMLVAAVDTKSSTRTFTHHFRLNGASDAFGTVEQAKLFKNAVGWLMDRLYNLDLNLEVVPPVGTVLVGQKFQYRILVHHSGESPASQVAVTDALPQQIRLLTAELTSGTWSQLNNTSTFELGTISHAATESILVTAVATRAGSYSHTVEVKMLGNDAIRENNTVSTTVTVVDPTGTLPKLNIRREGQDTIRVEMAGGGVGADYVLEVSDNLIDWSRINIGITGVGPSVSFSPGSAPRRFFRAVSATAPTTIPPVAKP